MILIVHLNSGKASQFKTHLAHMFTRVTAGDQTLHAQINENATSTAPLNAMARGELPGVGGKRARELESGEPLRLAKQTRVEYESAVLAANSLVQAQRSITEVRNSHPHCNTSQHPQ